MKLKSFAFAALATFTVGARADHEPVREIKIHAEKIGDATHWEPETITAKPGEHLKFVVTHDLVGGFDFHGFTIKELNISKQVNRGTPLVVEATIPADAKTSEYKIVCQFHPKHVGANLEVKEGAEKPASAPAAPTEAKKK